MIRSSAAASGATATPCSARWASSSTSGVEVGLASIAVNYFKTQGVDSLKTASFLVALYWGGALIGRLLGSWILTKFNPRMLLGIFGFAATLFVFVSMFSSGQVAIWAVVICGFFNSIMFPNIFALGIAGLGPMTSKGSGLIMTAVVGGAVVPYLLGKTGRRTSASSTPSSSPPSVTSTSPSTGYGDPSPRGLCKRRLDQLYKLKALRHLPEGLRTSATSCPSCSARLRAQEPAFQA